MPAFEVNGLLGTLLSYVMTPKDARGISPRPPTLRVVETGTHLNQVRQQAPRAGLPLTKGEDWSVLWSYRTPWDSEPFKRRISGASGTLDSSRLLVNHLPGTLRMASKEHLIAFARTAGLDAGTVPSSYLLPEHKVALRSALDAEGIFGSDGLPIWLFKSKSHRGVHVLLNSSDQALAQSSPAIVQRRVAPLLLRRHRHAFDLGLYVLVTSVRPLRVFAYERALVRFCEKPFPTTAHGFTAEPGSYVINHYTPIWTIPTFAAALKTCNESAACALRAELTRDGYDATALWERMHATVTRLLTKLEPHVLSGLARQRLSPDAVFELYRFDFMVNARGAPVLTEVNISPNLVPAYRQDGEVTRPGHACAPPATPVFARPSVRGHPRLRVSVHVPHARTQVKAALVRDALRMASQRLRPAMRADGSRAAAPPDGVTCANRCCRLVPSSPRRSQLVANLLAGHPPKPGGCLTPEDLRTLRLAEAEERSKGGFYRLPLESK